MFGTMIVSLRRLPCHPALINIGSLLGTKAICIGKGLKISNATVNNVRIHFSPLGEEIHDKNQDVK
jgi:hypothetical protein